MLDTSIVTASAALPGPVGGCATVRCPRPGNEQVPLRFGAQVRRVPLCSEHAATLAATTVAGR